MFLKTLFLLSLATLYPAIAAKDYFPERLTVNEIQRKEIRVHVHTGKLVTSLTASEKDCLTKQLGEAKEILNAWNQNAAIRLSPKFRLQIVSIHLYHESKANKVPAVFLHSEDDINFDTLWLSGVIQKDGSCQPATQKTLEYYITTTEKSTWLKEPTWTVTNREALGVLEDMKELFKSFPNQK